MWRILIWPVFVLRHIVMCMLWTPQCAWIIYLCVTLFVQCARLLWSNLYLKSLLLPASSQGFLSPREQMLCCLAILKMLAVSSSVCCYTAHGRPHVLLNHALDWMNVSTDTESQKYKPGLKHVKASSGCFQHRSPSFLSMSVYARGQCLCTNWNS